MKIKKFLIMLLVIFVVSSAVISPTLAKYTSEQEASGTFVAATMITETTGSNVVALYSVSLDGISPANSANITFGVVDYLTVNNNTVYSTVDQTYTLTVTTSCAMPLFYQLQRDLDNDGEYEETVDLGYNFTKSTNDEKETIIEIPASNFMELEYSHVLDASSSNISGSTDGVIHNYNLVVSWGDETRTSEEYGGLIDYVSVEISSVQNAVS